MNKRRLISSTSALLALALAVGGCQNSRPDAPVPNAIDRALEESVENNRLRDGDSPHTDTRPPAEVLDALLPPLHVDLAGAATAEPRFDIAVNETPAREFFMGLVHDTPYSMTIAPGVEGAVSLALKNVTVEEALEVVRNTYGYEYLRTAQGFQVLPVRMQTRVFHISHLNVVRSGQSGTTVSTGRQNETSGTSTGSGKGTNITTQQPEGAFWQDLEHSIAVIIGVPPTPAESGAAPQAEGDETTAPTARGDNGRSVAVNPHTGLVVVRAMPLELRDVETFLRDTQASLGRQVILEAKILEVELNDGYKQGINWSVLAEHSRGYTLGGQYANGNVTDLRHPTTGTFTPFGNPIVESTYDSATGTYVPGPVQADPNTGYVLTPNLADLAGGGVFSLALRISDFAAIIDLLKSQGSVHVLSSPQVSTLNNQKAVIKVGSDEYFVTGVKSNTDQSGNVTPEIEIEPFFSGVALDVTPQVSPEGVVTLHIHPTVAEVLDQVKTFTVNNQTQTLPLAFSTTREADSLVRAANGEVVVIGGLLRETRKNERRGVPGLSEVPVFGAAFRHEEESGLRTELVILLRPIVVDSGRRWTESLQRSQSRFSRLRDGRR